MAGGAVPVNVAVTNESVTQATTGAATAQGLEAQNGVSTSATANVRVGGNNYGAIQVVVDTVTNIVNVGQAIAGSGTAGAQGGAATTQLQGSPSTTPAGSETHATAPQSQASDGDASATGARVTNQITLNNNTTVTISGDNHSPLEVVVRLVVDIFNSGTGQASSRAATANGQASTVSGNGSGAGAVSNRSHTQAASGTAQATGLAVQNSVNLAASLLVDIAGNNYGQASPYACCIITNIYNEGSAEARTGNATANGAPATTSLSGAGPETTEGVAPIMISASAASGGSSAGGSGGVAGVAAPPATPPPSPPPAPAA